MYSVNIDKLMDIDSEKKESLIQIAHNITEALSSGKSVAVIGGKVDTFSFIIIRFIVYKFCCLYGNCFLPGCIWRNFSFRFLSRSTDMFLLVRYSSSLIRRMEGMPVWVSVWFTIQPSMKFSGQRLSWWMTSPMQPCTSMLQTVIRQQVRLTSSATR